MATTLLEPQPVNPDVKTPSPGGGARAARWREGPLTGGELAAWRARQRIGGADDLHADPDWCVAGERAYPGTLRLLHLETGEGSPLTIPFVLKRAELDCQIGGCKLFHLRPRELAPAGANWPGADEPEIGDAVFAALARLPGWDLLRLSAPTASGFWRYLNTVNWRRWGLRPYQPLPPCWHHLIRMPASMEEYISKFTAKTRGNRRREVRQLAQHGELKLETFTRPDQVEEFLRVAGALSRASYQHKLLGAGLRAPERIRPRLQTAAGHGWLRAYVLRCGGVACSYMLGYQYQGRYHYVSVGYDPAWRDRCAGTVLQMLVLEEMFERDPPAWFDFGAQFPQKEYFGNERCEVGTLLLFRRGLYPAWARAAHRGTRQLATVARDVLRPLAADSLHRRPLAHYWRHLRGC